MKMFIWLLVKDTEVHLLDGHTLQKQFNSVLQLKVCLLDDCYYKVANFAVLLLVVELEKVSILSLILMLVEGPTVHHD